MGVANDEIVLPHIAAREAVPLATQVRGTVIFASIRALRNRGYGERYLQLLDGKHHHTVSTLTAATWLPMDFALAHYDACDRLELDRSIIESIGGESGRFINETLLTVVGKLSRESGVTPWAVLGYANKLVARTWVGSSICVWKLGPKEARAEWIQQPVARYDYFRTAFGAFMGGVCQMFARVVYVREYPRVRAKPTEATYRVSWA